MGCGGSVAVENTDVASLSVAYRELQLFLEERSDQGRKHSDGVDDVGARCTNAALIRKCEG